MKQQTGCDGSVQTRKRPEVVQSSLFNEGLTTFDMFKYKLQYNVKIVLRFFFCILFALNIIYIM